MKRFLPAGLVLVALLIAPAPSAAAHVSGLTATASHGQTFLTWTSPPGTGWVYRVYRATTPPDGSGISHYVLIGSVVDSTWCDRRCSSLLSWVHPYVLPDGTVMDPTQGLFVYTTSATASAWYAVTCDSSSAPEDRLLVPGSNTTLAAVSETVARPLPVFQHATTLPRGTANVYTLWTSDLDTAVFPAMCNRPSVPYDCAVIPPVLPGGWHALTFEPHARGGSFLDFNHGTGTPGEWSLTVDDYMPTAEVNTFWFGYNEGFDITAKSNPTPTSGTVVDYTMRRVIFTLEWARSSLPIDTTRVYVMGVSMGGIGGVFVPLRRPDLIAASVVTVPLFDFSFESDPNTACGFNLGNQQRWSCDHLFGTVAENLPTPYPGHVFDLLSANYLVRMLSQAGQAVPPIVAFSGRYDSVIGWAEKPIYYATMRAQRAGGVFFFDTRTHNGSALSAWWPMTNYAYLYHYRLDRSFPAFSNCSLDSDPGDGRATSGDSVGTINGYLEWDTTSVVDAAYVWATTLTLRNLSTRWGPLPAPDSAWVDVTPRRLQQFKILPMRLVQYSLTDAVSGSVFRTGEALADANGVVTISGVTVHKSGTRLTVWQFANATGVGVPASSGLALSGLANPSRGTCTFEVIWPRAGPGSVDVFDVTGRRVRRVISGPVSIGRQTAGFDATTLAPGVYIVGARQGELRASRRVVVVR